MQCHLCNEIVFNDLLHIQYHCIACSLLYLYSDDDHILLSGYCNSTAFKLAGSLESYEVFEILKKVDGVFLIKAPVWSAPVYVSNLSEALDVLRNAIILKRQLFPYSP